MFQDSLYKEVSGQKGQTLLIVVLIMVVALTVGLSVVSRTITNLRTSTEQASSQKALSAAEAGVEKALINNLSNTTITGSFAANGNTAYSTTINSVSGTLPFLINGGNIVSKDDGVYIWLSPYESNPANLWQSPWTGILTIDWGLSTDACNSNPSLNTLAALEIAVISGTRANPTVTRYAVDPCSRNNNFTSVSPNPSTIGSETLNYRTAISITNGLLARVMLLYA